MAEVHHGRVYTVNLSEHVVDETPYRSARCHNAALSVRLFGGFVLLLLAAAASITAAQPPSPVPQSEGAVARSEKTVTGPAKDNTANQSNRADGANRAVPGKVTRYVRRTFGRYDEDRDGRLQPAEWRQMRGTPVTADLDGNGLITLEEFVRHVAAYGRTHRIRPPRPSFLDIDYPPLLVPGAEQDPGDGAAARTSAADAANSADGVGPGPVPAAGEQPRRRSKFFVPPSRLPKGLPAWFAARDSNGDGQLTVAEFAPKATRTLLEQFARYDADGDGLITSAEYLRQSRPSEKESPP